MKLNTFTKYRWTAELYLPVQTENGQFIWEYQRDVTFDLASGLAQTYVYSVEPLEWAAQLLNVTNSQGDRPYFVGDKNIEMFVTYSSPVFDIYGGLTGYQQTIMRNKPNNWESAAVAAADSEF